MAATQAGQILLIDDNGQVKSFPQSDFPSFMFLSRLQEVHVPIQTKFRPMHISSIEGVDDMILLGDLKESAILHNLHMRYKQDNIYVNRFFRTNSFIPPHSSLDIHWLDFSRGESL